MTVEQTAKWVIENFEGFKYTDDPVDTGGATKFGITQRTLAYYRKQYLGQPTTTKQDVENLTLDQASFIGATVFARESRIDELRDWRVRLAVYDYGFHSGQSRAIKTLQQLVGVSADGVIGDKTLHAASVSSMNDAAGLRLTLRVLTMREQFMQDIMTKNHTQRKWMLGWWARTTKLQHTLLEEGEP